MTKDSVCDERREKLILTYIRLDSIPKLGIKSLQNTADHFHCKISNIPNLSNVQLASVGWNDVQLYALRNDSNDIRNKHSSVMRWLNASEHHHMFTLCDSHYPEHLKELARPPLFIFADGDVSLLKKPQLAIVGTRTPSQYAKEVVDDLVSDLAFQSEAAITSGLALGIDGLAHRASLHYGVATIAVLGCGIDVIYPKRHAKLYHQIAEQGLILSEFLPNTAPHAALFPRRNRIISGLSEGILVIEAKIKSGSLVTAKYGLEQNKEIFAVPSAIYNPNAEGCHYLIKSGAKLTESAKDILEELPWIAKNQEKPDLEQKSTKQPLASDPLLDTVSYSATPVDLIAQRSGLSISQVLTKLLQYELRGIVASTPEGYVKLRG